MRGISAGGILHALHDAKTLEAFDSIHGASAGACAAAYFVAGQLHEGKAIYLEDICNRRVVNPYGILNAPCMVDTDYIVDKIIAVKRRLRFDKMFRGSNFFNVAVTPVDGSAPCAFSGFETSESLLLALKASLRVPGFREPGIAIGQQRFIDGGMGAPIPMFSAEAAGASHALVVGTQRREDGARDPDLQNAESCLLRYRYGTKVFESYAIGQLERVSIYRGASSVRNIITDCIFRDWNSPACSWHTIDRNVLISVESHSRRAGMNYITSATTV